MLTLRGTAPRRGRALSDLGIIRDGALLVHDDRITAVGPRRRIERLSDARRAEKLDLGAVFSVGAWFSPVSWIRTLI